MKSRQYPSSPPLPSHHRWKEKYRKCVFTENENGKKRKAEKASREMVQVKVEVKDLESALKDCAGSMLLFLLIQW